MSIELRTKYGQIDISNEVIAMVAGARRLTVTALSAWPLKTRLKTD